ncbi:MAG: DnaJ domain-containing protein [Pseudomonadota bacterium]
MQYFILGLAALVIALFLMRGLASANPARLAQQLRVAGGLVALGGAGVLVVRGIASYALPLAVLGLWLLAGGSLGSIGGARRKSPGQTSRVVTDFLDMELDHDSGDMRGKVLKGMFAGRTLASLKPVELALLWQDCRLADPASAQLVEAYLDRVHPSWREDVARGEARMSGGPDGRMSAEEAREILGLGPDADEDAIRRAHRELILKLHPDRGGSTYLAAKVNEAKDVLLGGR